MMDNLEKKLRDNAESKLPKNIDDVIENTLNSLENKPKKRKYKKGIMVASLSAIILSGIGLGAVAFENSFSVDNMLYSIIEPEIVKEVAKKVNIKQELKGITYEIENVGYYDNRVLLSYKITSKDFVDYLKKEKHGQYVAVPTVLYDDTRVNGSIETGYEIKSDKEVVGCFDIGLKKFEEIKNGDLKEITLITDIYVDKNKSTEFRMDIPVEKDLFLEGSKTYEINKIIEVKDSKGNSYKNKVTTLTLDPLNISLKNKTENAEQLEENINIEYILFDDKEREVLFRSGSWNEDGGEQEYTSNLDMEKLYIVPARSINYAKDLERELKVNIKRGKITVEENEDFKVETEKIDGFTRVTLTANTEYLSWMPMFIESREKWELQSIGELEINESQRAYESKVGLNKVSYDISDDIKDGDYIFDYQDFSRFEFLEDQIIEVDLTKK